MGGKAKPSLPGSAKPSIFTQLPSLKAAASPRLITTYDAHLLSHTQIRLEKSPALRSNKALTLTNGSPPHSHLMWH